MIVKDFDSFVNEMYMGPADGAGYVKSFNQKQDKLTYNPKAVSAEPGGFGNGGNAGAPAVGENDSPSMLSNRLGDIEPEGYPSAAGQEYGITQPGTYTTGTQPWNMRGEPTIQKSR